MLHNYLDANLAFIIFCFVVSFLPPLCIHFNFLVLFRKISLQIFKNIILIFFFILLNFSLEKSLYNLLGTWYCIYIWFFFPTRSRTNYESTMDYICHIFPHLIKMPYFHLLYSRIYFNLLLDLNSTVWFTDLCLFLRYFLISVNFRLY